MRYAVRPAALMVLLLSAVAWPASIKDSAGFFSPTVVTQAQTKLDQIQQNYGQNVVIETFPTPPPELQGKVDGNDASKNQAYAAYSDMRASAAQASIYVLIVKSPGYLQVTKRNNSPLTNAGRDRMRDELLGYFRNKDYDGGLSRLTDSLNVTLANPGPGNTNSGGWQQPSNTPPAPRQNPPVMPPVMPGGSGGGYGFGSAACCGLAVLLIIVVVGFSLVRRLFGGGGNRMNYPPGGPGGYPPGYGGPGYSGGGGGGFGRGVAGGLLGGLFGSWIGNRTFGQGHSSGPIDTGNVGGNPGPTADPGGYTSSGGDFGSPPAGSDTGGGSGFSSSGSDFSAGGGGGGGGGGGDSGGGGSF